MYNKHGDTMKTMTALMNAMRHRLGWDKTDNLVSLMRYLNEEVNELTIESEQSPINEAALRAEVADVFMVLLAIIDDLDIDIHHELETKIAAIIEKYEQT